MQQEQWEMPPPPKSPFEALLDRYVLWAIGALAKDELEKLCQLAAKLTELYGGDGTWHDALRVAMDFPATMPELIRERWMHNQGISTKKALPLTPVLFARMFVLANCGVNDDK